MKRRSTLLVLALLAAVPALAQPKVAVLDAIIPQNMDPSVIIPVTEKIMERLVVSGRFNVLDRANIESVLKEREFQLSGMVTDADVTAAGKYLGADFVVVVKVQKVGETYFISAKMIAIKTGVIANQTSSQAEGKISSLIWIAEQVGEVLSGGAVLAQSAAGGSQDISKPAGGMREPAVQGSAGSAIGLGLRPFGSFAWSYRTWTEEGEGTDPGTYTMEYSQLLPGIGLDLEWVQVSLSYGLTLSAEWNDDYFTDYALTSGDNYLESYVSILALGKYPFRFGSLVVFPLAGFEYQLNLDITDSSGASVKDSLDDAEKSFYNRFFFIGGVGGQYDLSGGLFIQPEFLYAIKLFRSEFDQYYIDNDPYTYGYTKVIISETAFRLGVSIGWRL